MIFIFDFIAVNDATVLLAETVVYNKNFQVLIVRTDFS